LVFPNLNIAQEIMKKKNYLLVLILILLSFGVFAQTADYPPPPYSTEGELAATIDDWAPLMLLPAIVFAFYIFNKVKK
jgi:H+/gluconate symporter-like permease